MRQQRLVRRKQKHPRMLADRQRRHKLRQRIQIELDAEHPAHRPIRPLHRNHARNSRHPLAEKHVRRRPRQLPRLLRQQIERPLARIVSPIIILLKNLPRPVLLHFILGQMRFPPGDVRPLDMHPPIPQPRCARVVAGFISVQHPSHPRISLQKRQKLMRQPIQVVHRQPLISQIIERLGHRRRTLHKVPRLRHRMPADFAKHRIHQHRRARAIPPIRHKQHQHAREQHQHARRKQQFRAKGQIQSEAWFVEPPSNPIVGLRPIPMQRTRLAVPSPFLDLDWGFWIKDNAEL